MADTVRYLMERMVPELEALEDRGYFSRVEIRAIVQKRQDFEYALKRKAAIKRDYLRYIEYERALEELRQLRRKERGITGKTSLAEYCIPRRIHFIYERLLRKFRGDLSLWSAWLSYCRASGAAKQTSRVLAKALRLHPTAPALWTYAAAWEFEHNLDAGAARALMQRGLRMCGGAVPALWHEYFRLELLYALRLRERRRVLGIAPEQGAIAEDEAGDESAAAVQAVLNGAVAQVVFRNAVAAVPDSLPFRAKFLAILAPHRFLGRADLEGVIYHSIKEDFAGSPEAWDLHARRHLAAVEGSNEGGARVPPAALHAAAAVYEEALAAAPGAEVRQLLIAFLTEQLAAAVAAPQGRDENATAAAEVQQWTSEALEHAYAGAFEAGQVTEEVAVGAIQMRLHLADLQGALEAARQATTLLPHSAPVWLLVLRVEAALVAQAELAGTSSSTGAATRSDSSSSEDEEERAAQSTQPTEQLQALEALALQGVQSVPATDAPALWLEGLSLLAAHGGSLAGLCAALEAAVAVAPKGPLHGSMGAVAAAALRALAELSGAQAARRFYQALLRLPPAGGELFHAILELELVLASGGTGASTGASGSTGSSAGLPSGAAALPPQRLHALFEAAADAYGSEDTALWLRYARYEAAAGRGAAQVYWRAVKALADPTAFIAQFQAAKLQR